MATNVLFIGDPHFKVKNVEFIPKFISRIEEIISLNKIDFIVVAGDLLDNHDRIDVHPLNLALQFINSISKNHQTFVLVGNHDYTNNQQFLSDHHWMNSLKKWGNVTIVDDVTDFSFNDSRFLFVPYVPPGRFLEAINTKFVEDEIKNFKGVFAHQEFYKCKMGAIESIEGDKWNTSYPMVVSGHIHNKQWPQPNIYYPGSAMQHAFGQSVDNTISLLSFGKEFGVEEIDLKMPKLIIKYLTVKRALEPLKYKNTEDKKYKLAVKGTMEEFKTFKKSLRYKELLNENFKVVFKVKECKVVECQTTETKKFIDILYHLVKIENDPDLYQIYSGFTLSVDNKDV
jgi:DNA repair exonuclease SbcCD nuclease subunit